MTDAPAEAVETLTIEKLNAAIKALGPPPPKTTFASVRMFPVSTAYQFEDDGETFTVAHPTYWSVFEARVRAENGPAIYHNLTGDLGPLWGIQIMNLDTNPSERERVMSAMLRAMSRASQAERA